MLFGMFLLLSSQKQIYRFWYYLSLSIDFLVQKVAGITYSIEGSFEDDDISSNNNRIFSRQICDQPAIYAVRHESTWETLVLVHFFKEPIFLIKKELAEIPIFGILAKKAGAIPVNREEGVRALMDALKEVQKGIASGHPIVMFPEGTRLHPGEHVELKRGISLFYARSKSQVIPVIHNSGVFWGRRSFIKTPGKISLKFLPPIEPGLSKEEFMERLNETFHKGVEELNDFRKHKERE